MRVAFVGIEKDWGDLYRRDYADQFVQYHLELPYYYAKYGKNQVFVVTNDPVRAYEKQWGNRSFIFTETPEQFKSRENVDVVVHWRKWIEDCYKPEAINVINSQDHSYGPEWLKTVEKATEEGKLDGILCFPHWHEGKLAYELKSLSRLPRLLSGVTLGVDTDTYHPKEKDPHALLWASDPGRGLTGAIEVALKLFQRDQRFRLHICWPDYAKRQKTIHPALVYHENIDNGPELWDLFNTSAFLPYTSVFQEPSSRAHRQAQAAGCVVLYPRRMGTPSDLIEERVTGVLEDPIFQADEWVNDILDLIEHPETFNEISRNARELALSENWEVQAKRFNTLFEGMKK